MYRVSILLTAAMIAGGMTAAVYAESASVLLEKGIYQENTVGNLQSAMDIYQQIIADQQANRPFVAQAYYRLGMCYLKKDEKIKAAEMFRKLLKDYPEAVPFADKAGAELAKLEPAKSGPPMVVRTTPITLTNDVDPGLDKITVTFDRPMMDKSWSFTAGDKAFSDRTGSIFPERAGEISYDATRTTCTMPVKLQPGKVYWVGINSPHFQDFKAASGTPARHYMILFATKDKDGKPTPLPDELVKQAREINDRSISIEQDTLKAKLINWVEKFFSENYRDITARKTLEWGEPETLPNGNLAIRYKYLATIWDKDKLVIDQRFTFKPDGQYVSTETIEKGPATPSQEEMKWLNDVSRVASEFIEYLRQNKVDDAYKLTTEQYRKDHQGLGKLTERCDLSLTSPTQVLVAVEAACVVLSPAKFKDRQDGAIGLGLVRFGESWLIRDVDLLSTDESIEGFVDGFRKAHPNTRSAYKGYPGTQPQAADKVERLKVWVEDVFQHNYRDITARQTIEWGQPEVDAVGNLSIRYKWLATIWDKDKLVCEALFTFTPEGEPVSVKKLSQSPASQPNLTATDKVASEKYSAEGWRLWRQQKHAEAEEAFQKAVAEDPANTNAWNGLGWAQFNQGKPLAAEEAFKKCLEREPKHAAAMNGLGWIEKNRNHNDKAIEYWQKSLQASPEATAAMNGLAVTYMEMGRYEEAVKFYAMLVEKEPNNKEAKEGLAKAKVALEKK